MYLDTDYYKNYFSLDKFPNFNIIKLDILKYCVILEFKSYKIINYLLDIGANPYNIDDTLINCIDFSKNIRTNGYLKYLLNKINYSQSYDNIDNLKEKSELIFVETNANANSIKLLIQDGNIEELKKYGLKEIINVQLYEFGVNYI
jgi:hypothetical protein